MNSATSHTVLRRAIGVAAAALLATSLAGCSVIGSFFGQGNAFDIKVGDCFNQPDYDAEEIVNVEIVDCSVLHDFEATKSVILTETASPGEDVIQSRAETECLTAFEEYTGQSYDSFTDYEFSFYWPTTGSWSQGDREILCLIYFVEDRSTGSVKNIQG